MTNGIVLKNAIYI